MDEIEQNDIDISNDENLEVAEEGDGQEVVAPKKEYTTEQKLARVERLRTKYLKEMGIEPEPKVAPKKTAPTETPDGLDEAQLDFLDLKGYTADEDIKIVEDIVKKTGKTVRQALNDEYVINKLNENKAKREVKDATPSNTRRAGAGSGNDLALAMAKYEQTRELPTDFELRSAVINAMEQKTTSNKPAWL